jgi:hypothetical protein
MASRFCTKCGTPRTGAFVYCPSCGFKFQEAAAQQPDDRSYAEKYAGTPYSSMAAPVYEPIPEEGRRSNWDAKRVLTILAGVVLVVLVLLEGLGVFKLGGGPGGSGPAAANLPPAGTIWFGSSFDPQTFAITNRLTTVTANQGFSFVARLPRTMDASGLVIRTSFDGKLVATIPVSVKGTGDVWGFSPGPLFAAGEWKYDLTDIGGNVLATGTITATP